MAGGIHDGVRRGAESVRPPPVIVTTGMAIYPLPPIAHRNRVARYALAGRVFEDLGDLRRVAVFDEDFRAFGINIGVGETIHKRIDHPERIQILRPRECRRGS